MGTAACRQGRQFRCSANHFPWRWLPTLPAGKTSPGQIQWFYQAPLFLKLSYSYFWSWTRWQNIDVKAKSWIMLLYSRSQVPGFSSLVRVPIPHPTQTIVWTETWWLAGCLSFWIEGPSWDVHLSGYYHSKLRHIFFSRRQIWAKSFISVPSSQCFFK